jgi:hypothetical protein
MLDDNVETTKRVRFHQYDAPGKGLEFRAVVVMACDDEVILLQERNRVSRG